MSVKEFKEGTSYINEKDRFKFVVNARMGNTSKFNLHRVSCHHISSYAGFAKEEVFTNTTNIKICSDNIDELKDYLKRTKPKFTGIFKICNSCNP